MFAKQEYIDRRNRLQAHLRGGFLVFMGNEESPMNYKDNTYHFRQDSTFLYFFGVKEPNLAAVIDLDNDQTILFGDEMSIDAIVWMGRQRTLAERTSEAGLDIVKPASDFEKLLAAANKKRQQIHLLPPYRGENKIRLADALGVRVAELQSFVSISFVKAVVALRSIKSTSEIKEMHMASEISADMHLAAMQFARPGITEAEVASVINQVAQKHEGQVAYPTILTINGQILHNHYHGNTLKNGDLVLNDSGAETINCYAGDLTRTFPAGKTFTASQKDMYNIVLKSYYDGIAMLKAGVRYIDVHYRCCLTLAEGLKDLGLMKGDLHEAVQKGAHALFFQCGTGHMIGMDVHDMEDLGEQYVGYTDTLIKEKSLFGLKSLRLGKELEAGYTLTVEPGLYFIPELIDMWKAENRFAEFIDYNEVLKFKDFGGIRVEDDYVITANGCEKLGKQLAIEANEIEAIRAGAY